MDYIKHLNLKYPIIILRKILVFWRIHYLGNRCWHYNTLSIYIFLDQFVSSTNFGESGYVARQSLAYLQNLYVLGFSDKKSIVFYDGVNDVQVRCRSEPIRSLSTERELGNKDCYKWQR